MSNARHILADLKRALMDGAPHRATGYEWCQALDVLVEEVRKECFANSPLTTWLMGDAGHRFVMCEYDEDSKRIRCNVDDVNDEGDEPIAVGLGESIEEAMSAAMNALAGKVQ